MERRTVIRSLRPHTTEDPVRHLTTRTAATAAVAVLLLGCGDDAATDDITLDDTSSSPEAIDDGTEDVDGPDAGDAGDTADAGDEGDTDAANPDGTDSDPQGVVDGTQAVPGTWQVGDAGTVTFAVTDGALVLEDVSEASGWTVTDVEEEPDEIEVDFRRDRTEVVIEIELTSGGDVLEIEIDTDIDDAEPGTYDIGDAGAVTFDLVDGRLELVDLTVTDGWEVTEQDAEADEIEIELRNGPMRWDVDIDLNGTVEVQLDYEVSGAL